MLLRNTNKPSRPARALFGSHPSPGIPITDYAVPRPPGLSRYTPAKRATGTWAREQPSIISGPMLGVANERADNQRLATRFGSIEKNW
jgi:hypothetical protein